MFSFEPIQLVSRFNSWNNNAYTAMGHSIKREIARCLLSGNMSFSELINAIAVKNHGDFGYHLRSLKGFIELDPLTKKYRLTYRGSLLAACIENFRFITSSSEKLTTYVRNLRFGDHAAAFYRTEDFKRSICTPYLKEGLSRGEAAIYVVSEHRVDSEMREIQRRITDFSSLPKGTFEIMQAYEWYVEKGKTEAETIVANWKKLIKEKRKVGFKGIRTAGETQVFFDYAKTEQLFEYERALGKHISLDLCGLCLYDTKRFDEEQFLKVYNCHGHTVSKDILGKTVM